MGARGQLEWMSEGCGCESREVIHGGERDRKEMLTEVSFDFPYLLS